MSHRDMFRVLPMIALLFSVLSAANAAAYVSLDGGALNLAAAVFMGLAAVVFTGMAIISALFEVERQKDEKPQ